MAPMTPPKCPTSGLFSFCGFPAWSQKTMDCVIPGNQTASSVKLMSISDVISKKFHLKLGFHVINMILTLYLFQLKCAFLKTMLASSFLAHHKLIHTCSKVLLYIFLSHRIIGNIYLSQLSFLKMQTHKLVL